MKVHLVDGTYELFRYYFGVPSHVNRDGAEVAATRGVVNSMLSLVEQDATHVGIATDHGITSFRNELWPGYKDGSGIEPDLLSQFPIVEEALESCGFVVWRMIEYEADDGLAAGVSLALRDPRVEQVVVCTPDKDLSQCVGERVTLLDRMRNRYTDEAGVVEKFGVKPAMIPDYLALVGDTSDGFPGVSGWGAKSSAVVLQRFGSLERIPLNHGWDIRVRGQDRLRANLKASFGEAVVFKQLATLVDDAPISRSIDELEWKGPTDDFARMCAWLDAPGLVDRAERIAGR
ncbi:MAG: 5'-3' exonuclease H3TH domain-containing protein [Gemmatimonadales bacterium]